MKRRIKILMKKIESYFLIFIIGLKTNKYGINIKEKRDKKIIVSLTSYPARYKLLHICLKSLLKQTCKPDKIILYIASEEFEKLPKKVLDLRKYGLEIEKCDQNIKPHKKYYYAMKQYPNDLVITVDDDCIYDKTLVEELYSSYLKYPYAVSARRVHKILFNKNNEPLPYNDWGYEYKLSKVPSMDLFATGVGGVLYPVNLIKLNLIEEQVIKNQCLNADDIYLKIIEILCNIPVVWVKTCKINPIEIPSTQKTALNSTNVNQNQNDKYLKNLIEYYRIDFYNKVKGENEREE